MHSSLATHDAPAAALAPRELGDRELAALLARAGEPVVVESHYAGWERPWRALSDAGWDAVLRTLGERVNGVRVESGASRAFAARFGLEILPEVLVFSDGALVARLTGTVEPADVIAAVETALVGAREREAARAELAELDRKSTDVPRLRSTPRTRRVAASSLARAG